MAYQAYNIYYLSLYRKGLLNTVRDEKIALKFYENYTDSQLVSGLAQTLKPPCLQFSSEVKASKFLFVPNQTNSSMA